MKPSPIAGIAAAALGLAAPALAHHSMAVYDDSKVVTLDGTVREFRFVNPHALVTLDVAGVGGAELWTVELESRLPAACGAARRGSRATVGASRLAPARPSHRIPRDQNFGPPSYFSPTGAACSRTAS